MIPQLKTELTYSKVEHLLSQHYEDQLAKEVSKIFQEMEYRVINNLAEYYNPEVMFKAHTDLILAPIHEMHKDYYELLCKYKIREFDKSRASGKRIVERLINFRRRGNILSNQYTVLKADLNDAVSSTITKDKLFGTSPDVHENLETRTYQLSEKTLARVDSQINDIIVNGYEEGMGIDKVSRDIRRRFGQLKTWESVRIARTEIHNSQCLGVIKGYEDMGVEYLQWSTARDSRVRGLKPKDSADHIHMEGEIIRMGGVFSNGLMYPGDMNGPAAEIINCRCQALPFIIPYGYMAPSFSPFREEDLIPIETEPVVTEPQVIEPTTEQLQSNLTKQEIEQYQWAKDVQTSEFISDTGKAKARETLEQLRQKALSGTPKPKSAPKPVKPVKATQPKTEPKPTGKSPESMTSQELYESMTKADKKKYDKFKGRYESAKKYDAREIMKHNLMEMRKMEQKQRTKLQNKGKRKPKTKPIRTNERTLDNIHKEVEVPTDDLIPQLEKWIDKRCKNVAEFGYSFDVKTGKLIGEEIRGKKGGVTMSDLGINTGSIHSHPRNGMSAPSIQDLEVFRCKKQQHHFMVSEHEIWYVKATDNFGIGGMGQQLDLQSAHKACRDRAFETVSKLIKKGKIEATEEAIAKALDKYTGDEILKTFNKPPWNKTLTVKRYYR